MLFHASDHLLLPLAPFLHSFSFSVSYGRAFIRADIKTTEKQVDSLIKISTTNERTPLFIALRPQTRYVYLFLDVSSNARNYYRRFLDSILMYVYNLYLYRHVFNVDLRFCLNFYTLIFHFYAYQVFFLSNLRI